MKYLLLVLLLSGCSSKVLVRDCKHLLDDVFECEK